MRFSPILYYLVTPVLLSGAASQAAPFLSPTTRKSPSNVAQKPMMNQANIVLPPSGNDNSPPDTSGGLILSDVIGRERSINTFASLTRDIDSVSSRLDDASLNTTVLAPLNEEIAKLPRKPWEDPNDYETLGSNAYDGEAGEGRANRNLRRFVETHIATESPWKEGQRVKTMAGQEVWYEIKDGKKVINPGGIEVLSIADEVANGEVWILKGVLNPPRT